MEPSPLSRAIEPSRASHAAFLTTLALLGVSLAAVPVMLQAALFVAGMSLSPTVFVIGSIVGAAGAIALSGRRRFALLACAVLVVAVLVGMLVQVPSWDNAHDSLVYHEPAAAAIAGGMNPVYDDTGIMWVDHYPKAAWVFSGGMYRLTGSIESGKVLNVLGLAVCFGIATAFFLGFAGLSKTWAYVAGSLVALNPIVIVQLDTHYVDGLFACLGTALVLLEAADAAWGGLPGVRRRETAAIAVLCAVLLANLKFTGLVFVVVLLLAHVARTQLWKPLTSPGWRSAALVGATAALILLVGVDPYVTNLMGKGNPFYPVFGADLTDVADAPDLGQRPSAYRDVPAPLAFLMSLADTTRAGSQDQMPERWVPKNPLSVSRAEIAAMTYPDARTAGFGPLFFLALLLAVVVLVLYARPIGGRPRGTSRRVAVYVAVLVVALTLSMMEAWWARLAPVFYLSAPLVAVAALARPRNHRAARLGAYALVAVLLANAALVLAAQAFDYRNRRVTRAEALGILADADRIEIRFDDPWIAEQQSASLLLRIRDAGVEPTLVPYDERDRRDWERVPALLGEIRLR